jgi:hypothetical protein
MFAPAKLPKAGLLLLILLASGLSACADYTAPDGSRINGPQVRENGVENRTLSYTVEDFHSHDSTSLDYMRELAEIGVVQDGNTGTFTVIFRDKTSGRPLLESEFEAEPDLLFQRKIHLVRSEPEPPREAPE